MLYILLHSFLKQSYFFISYITFKIYSQFLQILLISKDYQRSHFLFIFFIFLITYTQKLLDLVDFKLDLKLDIHDF
jgi:hypothetical protein